MDWEQQSQKQQQQLGRAQVKQLIPGAVFGAKQKSGKNINGQKLQIADFLQTFLSASTLSAWLIIMCLCKKKLADLKQKKKRKKKEEE